MDVFLSVKRESRTFGKDDPELLGMSLALKATTASCVSPGPAAANLEAIPWDRWLDVRWFVANRRPYAISSRSFLDIEVAMLATRSAPKARFARVVKRQFLNCRGKEPQGGN
jgi:hypothetical protein